MSWIKELKTIDSDVLDQHIKQSINTRFYTRITNLNACIKGSKSKWAQRYWTGVKEAVQSNYLKEYNSNGKPHN